MTDIRWTPIHVYLDRVPTFGELASQAWHLAIKQHFKSDTPWDRLVYGRDCFRLRRAARLARYRPLTFTRYFVRSVVLRTVPLIALLFLLLSARDAFRRGLLGTGASPADFLVLLAVSAGLGTVWGLLRWPSARATLAWADAYREGFMDRQRQLLSPTGWRGWRLVRVEDGYLYVQIGDDPKVEAGDRGV